MTSTRWAIGFLRGTAKAFARGNVSVATANGAVDRAQRDGVDTQDIVAILSEFGLKRNREGKIVLPGGSNRQTH
jgi:hypothetical protein